LYSLANINKINNMMLSYGSKKVDLNMLLINIFRLKFINTSLNYKINFKMLN